MRQDKKTILTFGGAYSNHIAATAAACKVFGLKSIGIIRGDETTVLNTTLQKAVHDGMELHFVSRDSYRQKNDSSCLHDLLQQYPGSYLIPEGGDNELGIKGCEAILSPETNVYTHIACAIGTGTTFTGIRQTLQAQQSVIGIPVLKGFEKTEEPQVVTYTDYHFGGYAKHTAELLQFKISFENAYHIPLDYVYTAKLFYAVCDLVDKKIIDGNNKVLVIHSGGLQGNEGYEARYNLKPMRQLIDPQG